MRKDSKWHVVAANPGVFYQGDPVVAWVIDTTRFKENDDCTLYAFPVIPIIVGEKDNADWPGELTFP